MLSAEEETAKKKQSLVVIGERKKKYFHIIPSDSKWCPYRIIKDGKNYTPLPLKVKQYPTIPNRTLPYLWRCLQYGGEGEGEGESKLDTRSSVSLAMGRRTTMRSKMSSKWGVGKIFGFTTSDIDVLETIRRRRPDVVCNEFDEFYRRRAPSMFQLREDPPSKLQIETEAFTVRFQETETIHLFEHDTCYIDRELPEAQHWEFMNKVLRKRKNDQRTTVVLNPQGSQTHITIKIDNFTKMPTRSRRNKQVQACDSDILETLFHFGIMEPPQKEVKILSSLIQVEAPLEQENVSSDDNEEDVYSHEEDLVSPILDILETPEFAKAITMLERILVSNLYLDRQLAYKDRMLLDPDSDKVDFAYTPEYLFSFACPRTKGKAVTSIAWSCLEPYLFAVGYGKYLSNKQVHGLVCIWNIKNMQFPERTMWFESPVTYVDFSKQYPRVLAVGFYDGHCALVDVVPINIELMCSSQFSRHIDILPIWQVKWFRNDDEEEFPVSVGQGGTVLIYKKDYTLSAGRLLRVSRREGDLKGVPHPELKGLNTEFTPGATCFCPHPTEPVLYLVGTSDGCVHICSIHYHRQHLDVFSAHRGPVTNIHFHPVTEKLFLTSGTDFCIRIWGYGIFEPLVTLKWKYEFIELAVWSPTHPLVIASISGDHLDIWDLRKKYLTPMSTIKNKNGNRNIVCTFTKDGSNILVGDIEGNIVVYTLSGMPFIAKNPLEVLADTIKKRLSDDFERLKEISSKLGGPFVVRLKSEKKYTY